MAGAGRYLGELPGMDWDERSRRFFFLKQTKLKMKKKNTFGMRTVRKESVFSAEMTGLFPEVNLEDLESFAYRVK